VHDADGVGDVFNNQPHNVARLLHLGADPEEKDMDGKTAWYWAVQYIPMVHRVSWSSCWRMITFLRVAYGKTIAHSICEANVILALELVCVLSPDGITDIDK
jgi:hypothetical protein